MHLQTLRSWCTLCEQMLRTKDPAVQRPRLRRHNGRCAHLRHETILYSGHAHHWNCVAVGFACWLLCVMVLRRLQHLRSELEQESLRLPQGDQLSQEQVEKFMMNARRSKLAYPEGGLSEFRALCKRLDLDCKQVLHQTSAALHL